LGAWGAKITLGNGEIKYLGYFNTEELATIAVKEAEMRYGGGRGITAMETEYSMVSVRIGGARSS